MVQTTNLKGLIFMSQAFGSPARRRRAARQRRQRHLTIGSRRAGPARRLLFVEGGRRESHARARFRMGEALDPRERGRSDLRAAPLSRPCCSWRARVERPWGGVKEPGVGREGGSD